VLQSKLKITIGWAVCFALLHNNVNSSISDTTYSSHYNFKYGILWCVGNHFQPQQLLKELFEILFAFYIIYNYMLFINILSLVKGYSILFFSLF